MKNIAKILAISILSVVLGVSVAFNFIQRKTTIEERSARESLKNELYAVRSEKDSVQLELNVVSSELTKARILVDSLLAINESDEVVISRLNDKLEEAYDKISEMTADTLYQKLLEIYECDPENLEFAFSECGITNIAQEREYRISLEEVNLVNRRIISRQSEVIDIQQQSLDEAMIRNTKTEKLVAKLYSDIESGIIELDESKEESRRLKAVLRKWQAGSIGAGAVIVVLLILL